MYHVQTLCTRAMWLHEGAVRLEGDSFDVTREYLTYHEEKSRTGAPAPRAAEGLQPLIRAMRTERADGTATEIFAAGEDMVLQGLAWSPDGRAPVLLFGIVRADGTPVYGAHSNDSGYLPHRVDECHFAFAAHFSALPILPGKYTVRAHALDPEGLRLFDTVEREIVVTGRTRDYGLVRLAHEWKPGTLRPETT